MTTAGAGCILRHAVALDALGHSLSMTKAAALVGVSKSQMSKLVAETEQALGLQLFARTTRAMRPTPEGARLLEGVRGLVAEARRIDAALVRPPPRDRLAMPHRVRWPERGVWVVTRF